MKRLEEIMFNKGSDKSYIHHRYTDYYERWFESLRDKELVILEIGVGGEDTHLGGYSLLGWEEYFPKALIYGVDIFDKSALNKGRIKTFKGSQDDKFFLDNVIKEIGVPDIIIDDGSHMGQLTIDTFKILFPHLKSGGIYVIEDVFCAYRWDFGGNLELKSMHKPTIMNYMFHLSHQIQRLEIADQNFKREEIAQEIDSIQFYRSLIKIDKK